MARLFRPIMANILMRFTDKLNSIIFDNIQNFAIASSNSLFTSSPTESFENNEDLSIQPILPTPSKDYLFLSAFTKNVKLPDYLYKWVIKSIFCLIFDELRLFFRQLTSFKTIVVSSLYYYISTTQQLSLIKLITSYWCYEYFSGVYIIRNVSF